jgi:hypothetical protein
VDFRQVTGVNPDALGEKSEVRSGVGIQRKIEMTGLIIAPLMDNFKRTREALAKTIHDAVSIAYTGEKIFMITDNPKSAREVVLSNDTIEAVKQAKYDVIISEEQDFDTVQEQQMDIIARSLPSILQFGPAWAEVLFEMSSIRDKDQILQKVREINAQNAPKQQHTISFSAALDKLSTPEKLFLYQEMGMPPQVLQAVQQASPPPTQVIQAQQAAQKDQIQAQAEVEKTRQATQTVQLKGQSDIIKARSSAAKSQADIAKSGMDVQMKQMDVVQKQLELAAAAAGEGDKDES